MLISSSVEEVADYTVHLVSSAPVTDLLPRRDLQTRPPIRSPSPQHSSTSQSNKPPLPPPKPKRPLEFSSEIKESMYFVLSPTGESVFQDGPQGTYEEMGYDAEELNRNPPPVWRPPPQSPHKSLSSVIYARVDRGNMMEGGATSGSKRSNQGMNLTQCIGEGSATTRVRHFDKPKSASRNHMKTVLNDPSLIGKLHEKRQELYGPVDSPRASVSSSDSPNPMENYEEICFDTGYTDSSGDDALPTSAFSRVTNMTLPPRRHNIGSEVAMMQCPPEEPKAQDYLSFQPSPSHSPRESIVDELNRDSYAQVQSLSPHLQRNSLNLFEDAPKLPPREAERMRAGLSQKVPVGDRQTRPAEQPSRPLQNKKSLSQEDLHQKPFSKNRPLPPRPASSSSFDHPPPAPNRITSNKYESALDFGPRDLGMSTPLPDEACQQHKGRSYIQPSKQVSDDPCSPPPPVPLKQSSSLGSVASVGTSLSHNDSDAPPVPSRRNREKTMQGHVSHGTLQSTPHATDNKPKVARRPPVQMEESAISQQTVSKPALSKPIMTTRPPVSPKPALTVTPTLNTATMKPQVKPRVQPRKPLENAGGSSTRKPVCMPRNTVPPAIPPR